MSSCAFRHPAGNAANTKNRAADICARITGEMSTAYPSAIPALLAFARGRGLSFTGYAYETVLHEMAAATSDACITRIELALAGGTGCQNGGSMVK